MEVSSAHDGDDELAVHSAHSAILVIRDLERERSGSGKREPTHRSRRPIVAEQERERKREPQAQAVKAIQQAAEKSRSSGLSEPEDQIERSVLTRQQMA